MDSGQEYQLFKNLDLWLTLPVELWRKGTYSPFKVFLLQPKSKVLVLLGGILEALRVLLPLLKLLLIIFQKWTSGYSTCRYTF